VVRLFFGTVPDDQIHRVYRFRVALFFVLVIVAAPFLIYQLTQTLDRLYLAEGGRDRRQRPDDVIEALKLKDGDLVADLGCGVGYFSPKLAEHGSG
jgi:2-polyprenyl-3-methyl-5-hydroxy-6-metoxy-1,4-benzoquinol methylase